MFYVFELNRVFEEFEPVGAYSNKAEADEFADGRRNVAIGVHVAELSFQQFLDTVVISRLGPIAKAIEALGISISAVPPQPAADRASIPSLSGFEIVNAPPATALFVVGGFPTKLG